MTQLTRRHRGFSLLEMALATGLSGILMAGIWQVMGVTSSQQDVRQVAAQTQALATAAQNFINENTSALQAGIANNAVVCIKITGNDTWSNTCLTSIASVPASLTAGGYLPKAFEGGATAANNRNYYGQNYALYISRRDAGTAQRLVGLLITTGGQEIPDQIGARIASSIGAAGGFIYNADDTDAAGVSPGAANATAARGAAGGWTVDLTSTGWTTIGATAQQGSLAVLTNLVSSSVGGGTGSSSVSVSGGGDIDSLDDGIANYDSNNMFLGDSAGNTTATGTSNLALGQDTVNALTTGLSNVAIGRYSLDANSGGSYNIGIGVIALYSNGDTDNHVAVGSNALQYSNPAPGTCNGGGNYCGNVGIGHTAGQNVTTHHGAIAIGSEAFLNASDQGGIAIGYRAQRGPYSESNIYASTTSIGNYALQNNGLGGLSLMAIGNYALNQVNGTGDNVAIGFEAQRYSVGMEGSVAVGYQALLRDSSTGRNTAIGYRAMSSVSTISGQSNVAAGAFALQNASGANQNVAVGYRALRNQASFNGNVAVGTEALENSVSGTFSTAIGYRALRSFDAITSGNTAVGTNALAAITTGTDNTALGYNAAAAAGTSSSGNTAVGSTSLDSMTSGSFNTAVGFATLTAMTTGSNQTAIGSYALSSLTTGLENTAVGADALRALQSGSYNVAIGYRANYQDQAGSRNVAFGANAMRDNNGGSDNVVVGSAAMVNGSGDGNVIVGHQAYQSGYGDENVIIGYQAAYNAVLPVMNGDGNVIIGRGAGSNLTTGSGNTLIGQLANLSSGTISNSIAIGGDSTTVTADNYAVFGNASITSIGGVQNWSTLSDRRHKTDIEATDLGLDFIRGLNPVRYRLINGNGRQDYGFIAQEIEALLPPDIRTNIITRQKDERGTYTLMSDALIPAMVRAMQEGHLALEQTEQQQASLQATLGSIPTPVTTSLSRDTERRLQALATRLERLEAEQANQGELLRKVANSSAGR